MPRLLITVLATSSLVIGQIQPALAVTAISRSDYEACQAQDETAFRTAITGLTTRALTTGLSGVDYPAVIDAEWYRLRLDDVLDKRVDAIVTEVSSETSWARRIQSLADSEKAKELAITVAERVYRSPEVKDAIEGLATGVGNEAGKHIELATLDAAEPAVQCLKAFLGPRYGSTVAATVAGNAGEEFGIGSKGGEADVSSGAVLRRSGEGMTGAAVLIVRRQLANMATRIGQRLVGSILSRLVSVVAGGVGLVLIAKDIWELRNGVLPIIAEEMKSKATKSKVREELAQSLSSQITEHVNEIGAKSAERMIEIWQEFRRAHAKVLDLAERNEAFRTFLDSVPPEGLARLDEVTSLILQAEGEAGVLKRLGDSSLDEAVRDLPQKAIDIARETRSLETAIKWNSLGAEQLDQVVGNELYRRVDPDDFTKFSLARLLAIGDPLAIKRIASLKREARDVLFEREPAELLSLARNHTEADLSTLARYLAQLAREPRERLLGAVIADAGTMQTLSSVAVRDAILASKDQAAAVNMMLRAPSAGSDPKTIADDLRLAWDGRVDPRLIWEKHPLAVMGMLVALFLTFLLGRRLARPRRRAPATP